MAWKKTDGTESLRRNPLPNVARQLWVFSGNECAWGNPNCMARLVTDDDGWVGEIAHIIGAEPTSARHEEWDGKDIEDLRDFSNLILLCKNHARLIDSPGSRGNYTVEYLRSVKSQHEAKFRYGLEQLEAEFQDVIEGNHVTLPTSMRRFFSWAPYDLNQAEEADHLALLSKLANRVGTVTKQAQQVLSLVVKDEAGWMELQLLKRRLSTDHQTLVSVCDELKKAGLAALHVDEWDDEPPRVYLLSEALDGVGEVWEELRSFGAEEGIDLDAAFIDLDFSVLD